MELPIGQLHVRVQAFSFHYHRRKTSKLQLQCKMGSDKVSIKEDPFPIYMGSSRDREKRKCICKLNVGGNDNFWLLAPRP